MGHVKLPGIDSILVQKDSCYFHVDFVELVLSPLVFLVDAFKHFSNDSVCIPFLSIESQVGKERLVEVQVAPVISKGTGEVALGEKHLSVGSIDVSAQVVYNSYVMARPLTYVILILWLHESVNWNMYITVNYWFILELILNLFCPANVEGWQTLLLWYT